MALALLSFLSFEKAIEVLLPLLLFSLAMVIYSIFVFKFYRFVAKKDIFELNLNQYNSFSNEFFYKSFRMILYFIEYVFLFPIFSVFWFAILSLLLTFLTKTQSVSHILLISMTLIIAVRITAYYSEELSKDLAKLIPFGLLSIFLVDVSGVSFLNSFNLISNIPSLWETIVYYFIFAVAIEFLLRMFYGIASFIFNIREKNKKRDYLF